ncbi:MAG: hypothetical protein JO168_07800 [Solirubrobacterales bacterium]|nr:hypothetical protein [Solirubrobacterales bacterium]
MTTGDPSGVRLSELLGVLSFGADLGMGQPMEHMLRQCLIALGLAERIGLGDEDREALFFASLGRGWGVTSMPTSRPSGSVMRWR